MDVDVHDTNAPTARRLGFGDDGSAGADLAWMWVNSHQWPGWQLEVVTAVGPHLDPIVATQDVVPREPFREAAFEACLHLRPQQDPRLALSANADLVVVGPRGPGLLKRLHLGSTADWLVRRPPAPLVVARHGRRTTRVLIVNDCSLDSWAVVDALARLPFIDQLAVDVVALGEGSADGDRVADDTLARLGRAAINALIVHTDDVDRLVGLAEERRSDLIAVAGGERRAHSLESSVAAHLLRYTDASMLIGAVRHAPARVGSTSDDDERDDPDTADARSATPSP
jgi:nucleotide-binding universal stress UspA family protein